MTHNFSKKIVFVINIAKTRLLALIDNVWSNYNKPDETYNIFIQNGYLLLNGKFLQSKLWKF